MTERAATWARVSTKDQDEAGQVPALTGWCDSHRYTVADDCRYTVHGKSAYHGKHEPAWQAMLADMRAGKFTVLVVWKLDRIDRKLNAFAMLAQVLEAGGRVEFVTQPHLNDLTTMGGRISLKVQEEIAYGESKDKSDTMKRSLGQLRAAGKLTGRPPWGYVSAGEKYNHSIVATADGQRYVRRIFDRVIAGDSLATIAAWLDSEGVAPPSQAGRRTSGWGTHNVRDIVQCPTYTGRRTDASGAVILRCKPLVPAEIFTAANQAMAGRFRRRGDAASPKRAPAMLTSLLFCAACSGPMYRVGATATFAGKYRCTADPKFGGQRRSECDNNISVDEANRAVWITMRMSREPVTRMVWRDGDDSAAQLAEVMADIADVQAQYASGALDLTVMVGRLTALDARKVELSAREPVAGHYAAEETGQTFGDLLAGLGDDEAGLRRMLVSAKVRIYAHSASFPVLRVGDGNLIAVPRYPVPDVLAA